MLKNSVFITQAVAVLLLLSSFAIPSSSEQEAQWATDFEMAKTQAETEGKLVLMSFQGSDWCANCKRLEKTLFESESFQSLAAEKLVLLKVDFPMKKQNKLTKEQQQHNDALADTYNKSGAFPLVLVLDKDGKKIGQLPQPLASAEAYLVELNKLLR